MTAEDGGGAGPTTDAPPESSDSATTNTLEDQGNASGRQARYDVLAGLRRRRAASFRLPVLGCGHRDPHTGAGRHPAPRGYRQAVAHLHGCGLIAAPDIDGLREMWRDPDTRELARSVANAWDCRR